MSKCPVCGKTVFFAERAQALGKDFHKLCLKCQACGKKLEPGNFADREGKIYCKGCYSKSAGGAKGYGFWSGASGVSGVYGVDESEKEKNPGPNTACPQCATIYGPDAKFCSKCGAART